MSHESFLQEAEERLILWRNEIEGLFSKSRTGVEEHGHRLRDLHLRAEQKLTELRHAGSDAWHEVHDSFAASMDELRTTFERAIVETTSGPSPKIPQFDWEKSQPASHAQQK